MPFSILLQYKTTELKVPSLKNKLEKKNSEPAFTIDQDDMLNLIPY